MEADAASRRPVPWWPPLALYGAVGTVLWAVSWAVARHVTRNALSLSPVGPAPGEWLWGGWLRYDGNWYVGIAGAGYSYVPGRQSAVAFFPGYPLAVRAVGRLVDNLALGGILVSLASGAVAMVLFWRWSAARLDRRAAVCALLALGLYPYAWYLYGAVYGDALFLVGALAAFTLFERDRLLLAGLAGAAATATRLVGLAVVVGLVVGVLERRGALEGRWRWEIPRRVRLSRARPADAVVLVSLGGLLAWCGWLWARFDDPLLFAEVQEAWGQSSGPRTWFKVDLAASLVNGSDRIYAYGLVVQAVIALGVLALSPAVARRFGLRYGAYTAVIVLLPGIGSQDGQGLGRYALGAFPTFALVGRWAAGRAASTRLLLAGGSGALLVLGTAWFAHGLYLS
ncbi:MAG: hypothetical protein AB7L84_03530 [Acidimicrobiia bacterium]